MKILLTVDFANKKFNNDYILSVSLLEKHSVLLVTSIEQLDNAYPYYDVLLIGQSSFSFEEKKYNTNIIYANEDNYKTLNVLEELTNK